MMKLAKVGDTFIDLNYAEKVIKANIKTSKNKWGKEETKIFNGLTSSKLRGLLTLVDNIYSKVYYDTSDQLSQDILDDLEYLKVKFIYEAAREPSVKEFIDRTHLLKLLDIMITKQDRKYFLDYCKYFEALVAYSKFYKMED